MAQRAVLSEDARPVPPGQSDVLRMAAGREEHLGPLQPLGLYAANGIFVGDYLTTKGRPPEQDYRMIEPLGFEVVGEE